MTAQSFTTLCTPGATVGSVVATVNNNTPANGGWWIGQQDLSIEALRNGVTALTDTGISSNQCYEAGSDALISCQSPAAMALNSKQDGMVGRDVIHPAVNDGWLGSNYNLMMSTLTVVTPLSTSTTATTDPRCIKDNVTGLTWQRDSSPLAVARNQSNLVVYQVAEDLRRNANANRLCGFTDWRLPTPVELHSLVSYGQTKPWLLIDPDWFGSSNSAYLFLAGTHYLHDGSSIDWTVDFFRGEIYAMEPFALAASPLALRLVRSPELPAWKSYQLSNDGSEVLDLQSGLIWHRCSAGQTWDGSTCVGGLTVFTHESALAYANTQTRWRLPNVKELRSLVEPSRRNPALDSLFFPETFSSPFWSSTPDAKSFANALTVDFNQGVVKSATRSIANAQVRLVR
jgi:hypothetical protein